jgi:hypothetical protein
MATPSSASRDSPASCRNIPITLIILTDRGSECNLTTSDTAWFRFGQECHTILLPRRRKTPACFQFAWLGGSWSSPFYIQFPSDPDTLYADESHCLASPEIRSDKDNPISCFCRDTIADARYLYFAQTRVSQ